jgi:hypothetical protein
VAEAPLIALDPECGHHDLRHLAVSSVPVTSTVTVGSGTFVSALMTVPTTVPVA